MAKTRVGVMLRESMGTTGSNKNTDLAKLTADYNVWCKKIHHLIHALKSHLASLQQIEKSRSEVSVTFDIPAIVTFKKSLSIQNSVWK
jgi:hypothetical protein